MSIETDKEIAERVLYGEGPTPSLTKAMGDAVELARRLLVADAKLADYRAELIACQTRDGVYADALLNKPVEVKRYDLEDVTSMGEAWREMNENEYGDWIRYDDHLSAMRSRAEGVPDGWKLVPIQPTDAMIHYGLCVSGCFNQIDEDIMLLEYKAMIDATPTPPGGTKCRKCGSEMNPSKALDQTFYTSREGTMSPAGPGVLIDCMKCVSCGWSVTGGTNDEG